MEHVRGDASKEIVEGGRETPTEGMIKIDSIDYELGEMARSRSGESDRWKAESIYRIPWNLRKLQEKAYQPQMVSIWPYHHGKLELKEMEEQSSMMAATGDWVMQMDNERKELVQTRAKESGRWGAASIYRIPHNLKKPYSDSYRPQVVSIGPYHHGDAQLAGMEVHKRRALLNFLERTDKSLECYVRALAPAVQDLRNAYPQLQPRYMDRDSDSFLRMMILDGCFILELTTSKLKPEATAYVKNDPIFSKHGGLYFRPLLKRDMLLLENQIPLLVLVTLQTVAEGDKKKDELIGSILQFLEPPTLKHVRDKAMELQTQIKKWRGNFLHILDLYRKSLLLVKDKDNGKGKGEGEGETQTSDCLPKLGGVKYRAVEPTAATSVDCCNALRKTGTRKNSKHLDLMRSATELTEAGIGFKTSETRYLNNTPWYVRGTLRLPRVTVDDTFQSLYLNLMAFERMHAGAGDVMNEVTSYVFFMDRLIDGAKDVSLLHWEGIIENLLGSDDDVAALFNRLSTNMCPNTDDMWKEQDKLAVTYRKPVRRCIAYAKHNYFTNAWVTMTIIAAILIFALTVTQTVYAVLDYHKKK